MSGVRGANAAICRTTGATSRATTRATTRLLLAGLLLIGVGNASAAPGDREPAGPGPLPEAWLAPADVTLCLHVEGAARLRADLARRPIARLVEGLVGAGDIAAAWSSLARPAGLDDGALFDLLLGRRFTLFVRATEADGADWAVVTQVDPARADELFRRLNPRRVAPRAGLPTAELPEHELRVTRDGSRCLIGPTGGRLADDIAPRLAAGPPDANDDRGLAADPALVRARNLGGGDAAIFVRHGAPMNGWSVLVADIDGEEVAIRHRGSFENPPIRRPLTELQWDTSTLDAIEDAALFAVIEPTDIGGGEIEFFAQAALGAPLVDGAMQRHVGDCRIIAVGEVEGRQQANRADMLVPTGAVAVKLNTPDIDPGECDAAAARLASAIADTRGEAAPLDVPTPIECASGRPRHVDLGPVLELLGEGHPILDAVSLNWCVARGATGSYYVMATHPEQLERMARAIEARPATEPRVGRWASCGTLNGRRLGRHLQSYSGEIARLAMPTPEDAAAFTTTIMNLSRLLDGVERCRWQMRRPNEHDVNLDVQFRLSAPESADR